MERAIKGGACLSQDAECVRIPWLPRISSGARSRLRTLPGPNHFEPSRFDQVLGHGSQRATARRAVSAEA